jgi:glycosyltransferase involved in cell wall biosynthesis
MSHSRSEVADVTVGLPVYHGDHVPHFQQAVDSVVRQTVRPASIIIVQDGPVGPALSDAIRRYAEDYDFITHIEWPENMGRAHVRNVSILHASTTYYAIMDADDICHPERIERQVAYLEAHPEVDILGTAIYEFTGTPDPDTATLKVLPATQEGIERMSHYRMPMANPTVMFRRDVFARIGLFVHGSEAEDVRLYADAVLRGVKMANLEEPLLFFRFDGIIGRRSTVDRAVDEALIRVRLGTLSPKLNLLKMASVLFRLMPPAVQTWAYRHLR